MVDADYTYDFSWSNVMRPREMKQWKNSSKWGVAPLKYDRTGARVGGLLSGVSEYLTDVEKFVVAGEQQALEAVIGKYGVEAGDKSWDVKWQNGLLEKARAEATSKEDVVKATAYVTAVKKMLDALARRRREGYQPYIPLSHIPTIRLPFGVHFGKPLLRGETDPRAWWLAGFTRVRLREDLDGLERAAYGECARLDNNWWFRFIFVQDVRTGAGAVKPPTIAASPPTLNPDPPGSVLKNDPDSGLPPESPPTPIVEPARRTLEPWESVDGRPALGVRWSAPNFWMQVESLDVDKVTVRTPNEGGPRVLKDEDFWRAVTQSHVVATRVDGRGRPL